MFQTASLATHFSICLGDGAVYVARNTDGEVLAWGNRRADVVERSCGEAVSIRKERKN